MGPSRRRAAVEDKPTIRIVAEKLLIALRACAPFASKDEERPHLMMLRFIADPASLQVSATDGHSLIDIDVPVQGAELVDFCVMTTHVPMLVKSLSRIDPKLRTETVCTIMVGRTKVKLTAGETELFVPRAAQQTDFPFVEKVIPEPYVSGKRAAVFGLGCDLVVRVIKAVSVVAHALQWTAPKDEHAPLRCDIVANDSGITGLIVFAPMDIGEAAERANA